MATIDYKEKYEQAMERARQFFEKPYLEDSAGIVRYIFPELAESEDERIRKDLIAYLRGILYNEKYGDKFIESWIAWLEKQGKTSPILSNSPNIGKVEQKPDDKKGMNLVEEEMTPFQKKVFCIIDTTIEEEQGLKQVCDELLALASNEIKQKAWNEEDEDVLEDVEEAIINYWHGQSQEDLLDWLKSLKERVQPRSQWKPSDEQIKGIECAIKTLQHQLNVGDKRLNSLYNDLKKLREE